MTPEFDAASPKFGLPRSLWIPIAAASVADVARFAGPIVASVESRGGRRTNALKVRGFPALPDAEAVPLWTHTDAAHFRRALHPEFQLWVHVDHGDYRGAWLRLGMPALAADVFLDHVANRRAVRLRGCLHPYVRLCPVSRAVNTSAGHAAGGEGMEVEAMRHVSRLPRAERDAAFARMSHRVVYADPMDLTKMLDVAPGTATLPGVRDTQRWFYPR
jgi:hypothetical protein